MAIAPPVWDWPYVGGIRVWNPLCQVPIRLPKALIFFMAKEKTWDDKDGNTGNWYGDMVIFRCFSSTVL